MWPSGTSRPGERSWDGADAAGAPLAWRRVASAVAGQRIGRRFVYLPSVGSTNDVARELAEQGEPEGAVVFADAQTRGRGRAGKSPWLTPPYTSIAVSVLLRPPLAPAALPQLGMLAAVAAVDAIRGQTGLGAVIKWPNDVLIAGRKAGGVLVESAVAPGVVRHAIVGIGLNVNVPASALGPLPDAAVPPTSLQDELGVAVPREALLIALLQELDRRYGALVRGEGWAIWTEYRARLAMLGERVTLSQENVIIEGVAEDVAPDGSLIVLLPSGRRERATFGELTLRPSTS